MFENVSVIGPGLIGSSVIRAMREAKLVKSVTGFDRGGDVLARAKELGVIDVAAKSLASAVAKADLVVVAVPVGAIASLMLEICAAAKSGAIIMDVGSVKGAVVDAAKSAREDVYVVPAHPVAGTERSGPEAGFATLFQGRWCILTPLARSDDAYLAAVEAVKALWHAIGADVEVMSADHHDMALAVTSHLPHLIAYTLVGAADDVESVNKAEVVKYSAGGFRDFTRIAASNPEMWRDIFVTNKDAVLEVLGRFSEELAVLQRAIRWGDADALEAAFIRSRDLRRAIVDAGQETAAPNFGRDAPVSDQSAEE